MHLAPRIKPIPGKHSSVLPAAPATDFEKVQAGT